MHISLPRHLTSLWNSLIAQTRSVGRTLALALLILAAMTPVPQSAMPTICWISIGVWSAIAVRCIAVLVADRAARRESARRAAIALRAAARRAEDIAIEAAIAAYKAALAERGAEAAMAELQVALAEIETKANSKGGAR